MATRRAPSFGRAWIETAPHESEAPRCSVARPQSGARGLKPACQSTVTRAGKRYGLHDDDERLAWLQRQGQKHGFALLAAERAANGRLSTAQGARNRLITLDTVLFEGVLQPTDAHALRQALVAGIGPGKALGLGMLSLAPLPPASEVT